MTNKNVQDEIESAIHILNGRGEQSSLTEDEILAMLQQANPEVAIAEAAEATVEKAMLEQSVRGRRGRR